MGISINNINKTKNTRIYIINRNRNVNTNKSIKTNQKNVCNGKTIKTTTNKYVSNNSKRIIYNHINLLRSNIVFKRKSLK